MKSLRVVVVDDSALARAVLTSVLEQDPQMNVVATGADGAQAVELARRLDPDILVMDIEMPGVDGLQATGEIMAACPCPILLVTGCVAHIEGRRALEGLARGALDIVAKPAVLGSRQGASSVGVFLRKVRLLAGLKPLQRAVTFPAAGRGVRLPRVVVGVVASTGGPGALSTVLERLRPDLDLAVLIVQHVSPGFDDDLLRALRIRSGVPVHAAVHGAPLEPGAVFVAPGGRHLSVARSGHLELSDAPPVRHHRPSGDVLLRSVATWGRRGVGVVLTGMGRDGADGLLAVKRAGGRTIAQDEATCTVYGMPRAAAAIGAVDELVPVGQIAGRIIAVAAEAGRW